MKNNENPLIAITMGDPNGVGPEIVIKAWQNRKNHNLSPFFYIADPITIKAIDSIHRQKTPIRIIQTPQQAYECFEHALPVLNAIKLQEDPNIGVSTNIHAPGIIQSLKLATYYALNKHIDAIVTAPVNKNNLSTTSCFFQGQTEFFADEIQNINGQKYHPVMMLATEEFRCVLVTTHIPLKDIAKTLSHKAIIDTIAITIESLDTYFTITSPRLAVCGLNPHAGEEGQLGTEEQTIINPALDVLRNFVAENKHPVSEFLTSSSDTLSHLEKTSLALLKKIQGKPFYLSPALASDSIFHKQSRKQYDCFIAMYHDQALIPIKMADFYKAVNITLGLPFIRTSPDHGTAYSIAGKNIASSQSMISAIQQASNICINRHKKS